MYHYTKYYAPQPIRPSETQFVFQRNTCNAAFQSTIAPVGTPSFTAAPQYYSSPEGGSWNSLSAAGQAKYAPPGAGIESTVFNTDELDVTSMSSSFTDALWSAADLLQGPFAHTNHAWLPNMNPTESPATVPPVPSSEASNSTARLFTGYPVCPEEHYRGPSQRPALKTAALSTSSCGYGLDVHATLHLPPQSIGFSDDSFPGGSSRGSSFPPRVIAPMPRRATQAIIPYDTPPRPAMPVSCIDPLDTMLSTWQQTSGTTNLINAPGNHGFMFEEQASDELYFAPAFDSGLPSQAAAVIESGPPATVEHAQNIGNQASSPSTVIEQSTRHINSFEEGVETNKNKFNHVTGGGPSTSSGEATQMVNTKRARHGQSNKFHGSTVRSEAAKKSWQKRKAMGAPLAPSLPKRARSGPSPRPSAVNLGNLRYQEKNQRTIASATEGTSFNQGGVKGYVAHPSPWESVAHTDKSKGVSKMKMKKRKLEDVPVRRVVPCD